MAVREELVQYLESVLIGPGLGAADASGRFEHEMIDGRLSLAYSMGMLYPKPSVELSELPPQVGEEDDAVDEEELPEDPLSRATALAPSSLGMSICVSREAVVLVQLEGAIYEPVHEKSSKSQRWRRVPLRPTSKQIVAGGINRESALEGKVDLDVLDRQLEDGSRLLTISISNRETTPGNRKPDLAKAIFQVAVRCTAESGSILPYPAANYAPPTAEERELRVIYGDIRPYGAGHGVAVEWRLDGQECREVFTTCLPKAHVWRPRFDDLSVSTGGHKSSFAGRDIFAVHKLAFEYTDPNLLADHLQELVDFYGTWIESQESLAKREKFATDAANIAARCRESAARMQEGVDLLRTEPQAHLAFSLANEAMLMSMAHAQRVSGRSRQDQQQGPFPLGTADTSPIDYALETQPTWRPFQLAFLLQLVPSLMSPAHKDRNVVDVIWFATGGGKTEAYLFAAAFELIRRRLEDPVAGSGVGVLNRYTYRFLTSDQFQRTGGMICALELLRRSCQNRGIDLGTDEFSIGLYVGGEVSPNQYTSAYGEDGAYERCQALYEAKAPRVQNTFPIESCPYCGTLLVPENQKRAPDGAPAIEWYGFVSTATSFLTRCPDEDCVFHGHLPVYFIDEQLYQKPTSFLLGTIDKFAMIPWKEAAAALLGARTASLPPSLIIQDELHLISGPLGTLAGIYEAGFEVVMQSVGAPRPKVIASTATIRNAASQCRRIYGKDAAVFPSPGIRARDSFFSKLDEGQTETSRLYVGAMSQGIRSTVAVSWTMAAILQGVSALEEVGALNPKEADAYWTLMAYHNSKRELGRIANATRDEIPTRLKVYAQNKSQERRTPFEVLELKAHSEVPVTQARQMLSQRHTSSNPGIDIAPCTNIISVGVDIDRLGLMLVNGQPKLTAEYIQATSRVGRGAVPGLVITCYSPSKPRDRSHYESFSDYHASFYSYVEPTSVTPGALPALDRALHAALVTAVRHGAGLSKNGDAKKFDPSNPGVSRAIHSLVHRLQAAYSEPHEQPERARILRLVQERVDQWKLWAEQARLEKSRLEFHLPTRQTGRTLLVRFGDPIPNNTGWHTLQSMRHVDTEVTMEG